MPEREKVINEMQRYVENPNLAGVENYGAKIVDMPASLIADAIALLKEQEPRVMTLEEVNALDWDYCYLEEERLPEKEYRLVCGEHILTCVTWPSITAAKITYGCDGYGKRWRCWSSRPTDAQREATPWES